MGEFSGFGKDLNHLRHDLTGQAGPSVNRGGFRLPGISGAVQEAEPLVLIAWRRAVPKRRPTNSLKDNLPGFDSLT
jgi:hypothetical protein